MISIQNATVAQAMANGTVYYEYDLTFNNAGQIGSEDIWAGGVEFDDAVSSDSTFQIGAAIINKCTITLNNSTGKFDGTVFEGDAVLVSLYIIDSSTSDNPAYEYIMKGTYIVNNASYTDNLITLDCYDKMMWFDKDYSYSSLQYPATLDQIVQDACYNCGVLYGSFDSSLKGIHVNRKPTATTFREVISWCAQIAGCFARVSRLGQLELKWFPTMYAGLIENVYNKSVSRHVYYITGVKCRYKIYEENVEILYDEEPPEVEVEAVSDEELSLLTITDVDTAYQDVSVGTDGYVVELLDNDLLELENVARVTIDLNTKIHGMGVKKITVNCVANPTIEAGDYISVKDTKHNSTFQMRVTSVRYNSGGGMTVTSAGEGENVQSVSTSSPSAKMYISSANRSSQIEYNIARPFSKEETYEEGDYVVYNDVFYKYGTAEESEEEDEPLVGTRSLRSVEEVSEENESGDGFDPSKWTRVVITDEISKKIAKEIARPYDESVSYSEGDYVSYNGKFYKCSDDGTTGTFDNSDWQNIIVMDELPDSDLIREIAMPYDESTTYASGDYVSRNGKFYKCTNDGVTGSFNSSYWQNIIVTDEITASNKMWVGSQASYDAISSKDPETIYFIYANS